MNVTPPSVVHNQQEMSAADMRQLCQAQLDRLGEKLPVLDVWLVCWNQLENKRDTLSCRGNHPMAAQVQTYLESERWITENLPFLELKPLSLKASESQAYVCGLGKTDTHWDYLLLWTEQHISHPQQDLVKEYAQLLQQYLTLYQETLRQRAKIQLLEQTLQQTDHQLRNPLSLIRLYAENLYLGARNDTQKNQANCIRQTVETISTSLGDLLQLGKQACLKRETHNLLHLWQGTIALLKPHIENKQITIMQPAQPIFLIVDCWQFEQVLQNLLDNAIHMSPIGGTITLNWRVSQQEIFISVSDQGPGLQGIDSAKLFTPFYSKRPGGTGLGLAIARKIVLDHQGSIHAETLPQKGAQFSIVLPR